jgi:hypothetical protein
VAPLSPPGFPGGSEPDPEPNESWADTAARLNQAAAEPDQDADADRIATLRAKVDELSARAAAIKMQRAEEDASTQAHLQARRDAEATPEPAAGAGRDFELEA